MLNVAVHSADIQDRDGAPRVLDARTRRFFPFIEHIFADGGYQGSQLARRLAHTGSWLIEIVKRPDIPRFEVLPKRLDRRAHARLDQQVPPPRPRLRASPPQSCRLRTPRDDPPHAQTACKAIIMIRNFPERL